MSACDVWSLRYRSITEIIICDLSKKCMQIISEGELKWNTMIFSPHYLISIRGDK